MNSEQLKGIAGEFARIGCQQASLPEPLEDAWARADRAQRETLEAYIQEITSLYPGLAKAYWQALGRTHDGPLSTGGYPINEVEGEPILGLFEKA